jgi:hypothetical protein
VQRVYHPFFRQNSQPRSRVDTPLGNASELTKTLSVLLKYSTIQRWLLAKGTDTMEETEARATIMSKATGLGAVQAQRNIGREGDTVGKQPTMTTENIGKGKRKMGSQMQQPIRQELTDTAATIDYRDLH